MTREINAGERKGARQEWRTARDVARRLAVKFGIDLDAMALAHNAIVPRFIGPPVVITSRRPRRLQPAARWVFAWEGQRLHGRECVGVDAWALRWARLGKSVFCNPPFAHLKRAAFKAIETSQDGADVTFLAPDNGDTAWYAALVDAGATVFRFRGRLHYEGADGVLDRGSAGFPSALYRLPALCAPRRPGAPVPTFAMDPDTLAVL